MSGSDTGVCWCASGDSKCPHNINSRINGLWNEMEAAVDEVLEQFDRRSIKKYLTKEHKPSQTEKVRNMAFCRMRPKFSGYTRCIFLVTKFLTFLLLSLSFFIPFCFMYTQS